MYPGYAILQLPEFCRNVWQKVRYIVTKRKARQLAENISRNNVVAKETNVNSARDVENAKDQAVHADIQQYFRTRIQIIRNFQEQSLYFKAKNEEKPLQLENFLMFEVNALHRLMDED